MRKNASTHRPRKHANSRTCRPSCSSCSSAPSAQTPPRDRPSRPPSLAHCRRMWPGRSRARRFRTAGSASGATASRAAPAYHLHFLSARSAACLSITHGRTTCFISGPEGSGIDATDAYAAGAITRQGGKLVLRMTWVQNPNGLRCFADDAYRYRYTPTRITLLPDTAKHCHRELPDDPFTHLTRVR